MSTTETELKKNKPRAPRASPARRWEIVVAAIEENVAFMQKLLPEGALGLATAERLESLVGELKRSLGRNAEE